MRKMSALLVCLSLSACGDSAGPERAAKVNITGRWEGSVQAASLTLTLVHDTMYGGVSGAGYMADATFETTLAADGVFADSIVTLNLSSSGVDVFSMTGIRRAAIISGTLNGSGFVNTPFQLSKK